MLFNFWNQSTQSALIRRYCAVISKCIYNGQSSKLCAIFLFCRISTWSFPYYILNWEAVSFTLWASKHEVFILPRVTCKVRLLLKKPLPSFSPSHTLSGLLVANLELFLLVYKSCLRDSEPHLITHDRKASCANVLLVDPPRMPAKIFISLGDKSPEYPPEHFLDTDDARVHRPIDGCPRAPQDEFSHPLKAVRGPRCCYKWLKCDAASPATSSDSA